MLPASLLSGRDRKQEDGAALLVAVSL